MRIFTLLLFLLLTVSARAQNPGTVAGTVRDRATQEALPGVSVTLDGTSFGTATDAEGRYRLTGVPAGAYNLRAAFVGYDPLLRADIAVSSGNVNTIATRWRPVNFTAAPWHWATSMPARHRKPANRIGRNANNRRWHEAGGGCRC